MEDVDRFYIDTEVGEEVYVEVNFPSNDPLFDLESEVIVPMTIVHIQPYFTGNGSYIVEMILSSLADSENCVYRIQIHPGEYFQICVGETRISTNGTSFHCRPSEISKPKLTKSLVRLVKANKSMVDAKYEAYLDPEVAAMAETPGLITRNRAYKRSINSN